MITKQKGTTDIYGIKGKKWLYINQVIEALCQKYNYEYMRTPIFEATELFHRGVGDTTDIVTKETYDFKDRGDRNITLRPEGTAGIVRSYIENKMYGDATQPVKVFYNGTMYRYERPQSGRMRELTQFGCEVLGCDDPYIDAEIISIPVQLFRLLGLKEVKVNINTLGDQESRDNYRNALIEYFRPHIDTLCEDCQSRFNKNPLRILDCKVDGDKDLLKNAPKITDYLNDSSRIRYNKVKEYLDLMEIPYNENPNIVRGLDYYNHTVFEIEASVEGFGAQNVLAGGGRYNTLVENLDGPHTPAIGFACGLDRLLLALESEDIEFTPESLKTYLDAILIRAGETENIVTPSIQEYHSLYPCGNPVKKSYKYIIDSEPYILDTGFENDDFSEEMSDEAKITSIVQKERRHLMKDNDLATASLAGECEDSTLRVLIDSASKGFEEATCLFPGAYLEKGSAGHNCSIINLNGKSYLIDCTYRQFFEESLSEQCGIYMINDESRRRVAEQI